MTLNWPEDFELEARKHEAGHDVEQAQRDFIGTDDLCNDESTQEGGEPPKE